MLRSRIAQAGGFQQEIVSKIGALHLQNIEDRSRPYLVMLPELASVGQHVSVRSVEYALFLSTANCCSARAGLRRIEENVLQVLEQGSHPGIVNAGEGSNASKHQVL